MPLEEGVALGIQRVLKDVPPEAISHVFIGTTHALNALLSLQSLLPIGLIRLAGHRPQIPAGLRWNASLKKAVIRGEETISGGFECHGTPISPFNSDELKRSADRLLSLGAQGFAIVSCFGTLYPDHEEEALSFLRNMVGYEIPITLSSSIGGLGFLERENSTILNTTLHHVITHSFATLEGMCRQLRIKAKLAFVQNDGSQMSIDEVKPILTLSCGPTNSAKGGMHISGQSSCVVVDIGGTSTDIVSVANGFVKRSSGIVSIADVRMRFASPDVVSLAIGGGSIVEGNTVGPRSTGRRLLHEAQAFGGHSLTLTDLALLLGFVHIDGAVVSNILCSCAQARHLLEREAIRIAHAIRLVRGENQTTPCVLVGGGAPIFQQLLKSRITNLVELSDTSLLGVANALGAAQSEISGRFDALISLQDRKSALDQALAAAKKDAVQKGANPDTLRIGELSIEPLAYSKDRRARVSLSVLGK